MLISPCTKLKLVGIDPSLRNWGIAVSSLDLPTNVLTVDTIQVINPIITESKQVRQNSKDLDAAVQLYKETFTAIQGAHAIFIEVPVGSQNARSMASYGICVGILGALRASGVPFFEVTATEVKLAGAGIKLATKGQMISWAVKKHPEANWTRHKDGIQVIASKSEHQADAIAAIYAGITSNTFQQLLAMRAA